MCVGTPQWGLAGEKEEKAATCLARRTPTDNTLAGQTDIEIPEMISSRRSCVLQREKKYAVKHEAKNDTTNDTKMIQIRPFRRGGKMYPVCIVCIVFVSCVYFADIVKTGKPRKMVSCIYIEKEKKTQAKLGAYRRPEKMCPLVGGAPLALRQCLRLAPAATASPNRSDGARSPSSRKTRPTGLGRKPGASGDNPTHCSRSPCSELTRHHTNAMRSHHRSGRPMCGRTPEPGSSWARSMPMLRPCDCLAMASLVIVIPPIEFDIQRTRHRETTAHALARSGTARSRTRGDW